MSIMSAAVMLFFILDPFGNLPIFVTLLQDIPPERRRKLLIRELLIALAIMLIFLFAGNQILSFLHITPESVSISGGVILFIIAIRLIFPSGKSSATGLAPGEEPFIVPMAVPFIAGPSIMATLMLLANKNPDRIWDWCLALLLAWGASSVVLMGHEIMSKVIGKKGLRAMERLMGLLLIMISTQMFLDGVKEYLHF